MCSAAGAGAASVVLAVSPALAEDQAQRFELTLHGGYRIGGEFDDEGEDDLAYEVEESNAQRVTLNVAASPATQWEVLFARQRTTLEADGLPGRDPGIDIDVEYLHFGGTYLLSGDDTRPFIVLTAGLARFDPRDSGIDAENYVSASIGGGLQLRTTKRLGLRLEARAFMTLVDDQSGLFCRSGPEGGACLLAVDGGAVVQWEAGAGIVYRF